MRLLDKRFAGEARGVGSCKILGKVHVAQMKLGGSFFSVSLTVLENNDVCKLTCILIVHFYEYNVVSTMYYDVYPRDLDD